MFDCRYPQSQKVRIGVLAAALLFVLAGCSWIPWHPFGTPLTAEKKAEAKENTARADVVSGAQAAIHKASYALDLALVGNPRALALARDFLNDGESLIDQAEGAPSARNETAWRDLVARLASDNAKVRASAEKENAANDKRIAEISDKLAAAMKATEAAEARALKYAAEKEQVAGWFLKLCWISGILLALYFSGQILAFLAHFNPAFAGASRIINSIVSPAMHSLLHRAESAIAAPK